MNPFESDLSLKGRVALVTGAGGGIGSSVCRALLIRGARILGIDRPGIETPAGVEGHDCDLSEVGSLDALFESLTPEFQRIDILVHCAGINRDRVLWKLQPEDWASVIQVNLTSAFDLLRRATPLMRQHGGSIVLVTSINGQRGKLGQANYCASKAGLIGLGQTAARELGRFGIRVNLVAPGMIETSMTGSLPGEVIETAKRESVLGRIGQPEDVAHSILFLVSDMSRHITGQVLRVDGGQLIG